MPRNGFRKATLAVVVASTFGGSGSSEAAITEIKGDYTTVDDVAGTVGESSVFSLKKDQGTFYDSCSGSLFGGSCTFTNTHTISGSGANSVFSIVDGAHYIIDNSGVINAAGGTFISAGSAGTKLKVINRGSIDSSTAIDYTVDGGELRLELQGGVMNGNITIADDPEPDYMLLSGGSFIGTSVNIDNVWVQGGVSSINGTLDFGSAGTPVFEVDSGGVLFTSGLTVNNSDLTLNYEGNLQIEVGKNTNLGNAVITLDTTKSANVSQGEVVIVPTSDFSGFSNEIILINKVSAADAKNAIKVSPLYALEAVNVSGSNALTAKIAKSGTAPEDIVRKGGASRNASKAYGQAAGNAGVSNAILYRAAASKAGVADSVAFAEELAPTTNGGAIALAQDAQDLSHQNIVKRLNSISPGSGLNAGSLLDGKTFWVQGLYGEGKQKDRSRSDGTILRGYSSRINGFTMGMDMELSHALMAGVAVSIGRGTVNKNKVKDNTEMDTYMATLYGRWYLDSESDTNLDIFLSYGLHKNKRERFFDIENTILNEAESNFGSKHYGIKAVLSQTMMFDEWAVTPLVGFHYGRFYIDGYKEKGSAAALEMNEQRYEIIEAGLGVSVGRAFRYNETEIIPEVKVSGWHDFSGEGVQVQTRFVSGGDSFVAKGLDPEKTTWSASAGVTFVEDERFEMSSGYERNWRKGFHSDNVYLRAEYKF